MSQIIACVNDSNVRSLIDRSPELLLAQGLSGPTLTVKIITRATNNIFAYAGYSYLLQSLYAAQHAYIMQPLWPDSKEPDYNHHRKLVPLLEAMRDSTATSDYVAWFDAGKLFSL